MFDREIRGQLAMLMGGRAAEELSCEAVSTGAVDDIRRATDLAYKAVSGESRRGACSEEDEGGRSSRRAGCRSRAGWLARCGPPPAG